MTGAVRPTHVTVVLPVADLGAAVAFYRALLGRGPDEEPAPGLAEFELRPGVWLQLSTGDAAPEVLLGVDDLAAACAHAASVGAAPSPVAAEGPVCWSTLTDPDGNRLALVQLTTD
ncbi:VOC family protein [Spirilliplanes yamanashiensis]|uniref:Glyoxalase n=1 Tax=Spirilliplanes yamanashiensis TaxID=42233 RepID=A0A8J3Y8X0_9ACTN|nr:VOC family protein [Spirilliplanes yamanashiensis]MDP9816855.1 putative enzyme related to lactoylglutathione lyase [Spirilliplanes yamanashiensis]GIJ03489.1 glyoxalase [Spirilliplanes yamanashiensis]